MSEKNYYWLKLKEDFFRQKEIKKLRKIAGGDTYTIIYLKMQLLSLKNEGFLFYEGTEETFEEQLALEIDEDLDNIKVTVLFLFNNNLMEKIEDNEFFMHKASECIGKEGKSAERVRKFRERQLLERQKGQTTLQCNNEVTNSNTETETEQETEIETEIEQQQDKEQLVKVLKNEFTEKDTASLVKHFSDNNMNVSVAVVVEKLEIINHMKKIKNKPGALIKAIQEDWKVKAQENNNLKFNNFEQRQYDYDDLEKKLLGWD